MDFDKLDLDRLKNDVAEALSDGIQDLVEGAKDDVKRFAQEIAKDLLDAKLAGDHEGVEQLLDQLLVLAEINRVRAENHVWVVVRRIAKVAIQAAVAGVLSVSL